MQWEGIDEGKVFDLHRLENGANLFFACHLCFRPMLKSTKRTLRDPLNDVKMCGSQDDTDDGSTAYPGPHLSRG